MIEGIFGWIDGILVGILIVSLFNLFEQYWALLSEREWRRSKK